MKPSPRAVAFISAHQHHRAQNAVGPQRLSANPSLVGHKWPSTLLLPILGCSVALHPIYKVGTGPSSHLAGVFKANTLTSGRCLDFMVGVGSLLYILFMVHVIALCHIRWALPPTILQLQREICKKTQVWVLCKAWKIALKPLCAPVCLKQSRWFAASAISFCASIHLAEWFHPHQSSEGLNTVVTG